MEDSTDRLVSALRAAGCVFAAAEAELIRAHARDAAEIESLLSRRVTGEPLEHLLGFTDFGPLRLSVGAGVFVPRQRSLLLARIAVEETRIRCDEPMLEAFCGTAPIAATVARELCDVDVHATDIDEIALRHARRNLGTRATIHRGNGLSGLPRLLRNTIGVIAAVPPYVPDAAIGLLAPEARDHEPRRALVGGPAGLDHIRALVDAADDWLAADGCLLLEMNRAQFEETAAHAARYRAEVIRGPDGQTVVARLRRPTEPGTPGH